MAEVTAKDTTRSQERRIRGVHEDMAERVSAQVRRQLCGIIAPPDSYSYTTWRMVYYK